MATEVILTGTGVVVPDATRAGPGVLVRHDDVALQFDAGRATTMRLAALGVSCSQLTALFITHHHSDHLLGVQDLILSRGTGQSDRPGDSLPVVAPRGPSSRFVEHVLDIWQGALDARRQMTGRTTRPALEVLAFEASGEPETVWSHGPVHVSAVRVKHVEPSVAYRVDTPSGAIVISGDTVPCLEVEQLCAGADVLVHEAMLGEFFGQTPFMPVHTDPVDLGALAARAAVPALILTHLIPPPRSAQHLEKYAAAVREGGYGGEVVVGEDLYRLIIP